MATTKAITKSQFLAACANAVRPATTSVSRKTLGDIRESYRRIYGCHPAPSKSYDDIADDIIAYLQMPE